MKKEALEKAKTQLKEGSKETVTFLKKVPKPVYYGLGGLALYYWGLKPILSDIGDLFKTDPGNEEFDKGKGDVIKRPTGDGTTTGTLTDNEIRSIAQRQLAKMDRPGTSNDLKNDLIGLSGKDLQRVYNAFGKVWYDPILGVQSGSFFSFMGHQELDLFGWYNGELSDSELNEFRAIWQKSGLSFPAGPINTNALT
tara:strand:+ start:22115 stop:22702 length:588 start_codon:yes stop_codon:yes gene_type:complete